MCSHQSFSPLAARTAQLITTTRRSPIRPPPSSSYKFLSNIWNPSIFPGLAGGSVVHHSFKAALSAGVARMRLVASSEVENSHFQSVSRVFQSFILYKLFLLHDSVAFPQLHYDYELFSLLYSHSWVRFGVFDDKFFPMSKMTNFICMEKYTVRY